MSNIRQEDRDYWLSLLSQDLGRAALLLDYKRSGTFAPRTEHVAAELGGAEFRKLTHLVGGESPLLMLAAVAASLAVCLRRHSTAPRALLGTPALKEHAHSNAVVIAVNTGDAAKTFGDLLTGVRDSLLAAYRHQSYPIEELSNDMDLELSVDRCPFFDILVRLDGMHGSAPELKHDIELVITRSSESLQMRFAFSPNLFRRDSIGRFARQLHTTLAQGLQDLSTPIEDLSGLDREETARIVSLGTGKSALLPQCGGVHELFERQARRTPDAVALRSPNGVLSYDELDRRANCIAQHLRSSGVGPEVLVGLCLERSWELVAGMLGIHKAGAAYLALDPTYPPDRIGYMVEDAKPRLILTQSSIGDRLLSGLPTPFLALDARWEELCNRATKAPVSGVVSKNLAYCMYTSGSTGRPKGVLIEHQALLNRMVFQQAAYPLTAADRVIHKTSLCFDGSVWEIYAALISGAELVVAPPDAHSNLDAYIDTVATHGVTVTEIVPTLLEHLLEHERFPECGSLRLVYVIGEPLSLALAERFIQSSSARIVHAYGQTEATVDATSGFYEHGQHPRAAPVGQPLDNMTVHILDRRLNLVPQGAPGEVCIGGPQLARGYLNAPALTAERFIPDPHVNKAEGARLYRSGDLARYMGDGHLEFIGRDDDQIKLRGQRIELGEIECVIAEDEGVRQCHVTVRQDHRGVRRVVAYIVGRQNLALPTLRERLATRLTEVMVPSAFVFLESMPLLPNGKVDRSALPNPGSERPEITADFVAPSTPWEQHTTAIWQEVLQLDRIGVDDNFFELGGDSILTLLVASKAHSSGLRLTPRQIYEHQTVRALATVVASAQDTVAPQEPIEGPVPLTPIQRWFFDRQLPNPHHYNQAYILQVQPIEPAALETALTAIVIHHDALRHRFSITPDGVEQLAAGHAHQEARLLETVDLGGLTATEIESRVAQKVAEAQRSLNIHRGPLLRAVLFKDALVTEGEVGQSPVQEGDRLFIAIHHLAVDGISWRILLEDLETAYTQVSQGRDVVLPQKTTPFKEWAERLESFGRSQELATQKDYWVHADPVTKRLPVDYESDAREYSNSSRTELTSELDADATNALLEATKRPRLGRTVDVLVTALARSLTEWTGNYELHLDFETHGREQLFDDIDLARTVGWFTAVFPVWLDFQDVTEPVEQVAMVRKSLQDAPTRGVGYSILRYLGDRTDRRVLSSLRQPEVLFNYLGRLDRIVPHGSMFRQVSESTEEAEDSGGTRTHLLEIGVQLVADRLRIRWRFSTDVHRRETILKLAASYSDQIQMITRHIINAIDEGPKAEDFPHAGLGQGDLDKVLARAAHRMRHKH